MSMRRQEPSRFEVTRQSTTITYGRLMQVARYNLKHATAAEEGSSHGAMAAVVFCAFALEAFLNHLGPKIVPNWDEMASARTKLGLVAAKLEEAVDFGSRPFSAFRLAFKVRDHLAHGKTVHLADRRVVVGRQPDRIAGPKPEWELLCALGNAQTVFADTREIIMKLHSAAGLPGDALGSLGVVGQFVRELP